MAGQDVFSVGGGSTANLLAVWRVHGLDALLREAYARRAVLAGISAGMNCCFDCSTTDSFGAGLAPLRDGLGILPGSACPHYEDPSRSVRQISVRGSRPPRWLVRDAAGEADRVHLGGLAM